MIDRMMNRKIFNNKNKIYKKIFEEKGTNSIIQYSTGIIKYPNEETIKNISYVEHVWTQGDRLYKLAEKYVGSTKDWWIILAFNKIGSEVSIKQGDVIRIPLKIEEIITYFI